MPSPSPDTDIKYTSAALLEHLTEDKAGVDHRNLYFPELPFGTKAQRRIDLFEISCFESKGFTATAYEIKISRSDFKRETEQKQRPARMFSDHFWYVTPPGLIKPEEIPLWAGLMEIDLTIEGYKARKKIVPAPKLDKLPPSWDFLIACSRKISGWSTTVDQKMHDLRVENYNLDTKLERLQRKRPPPKGLTDGDG